MTQNIEKDIKLKLKGYFYIILHFSLVKFSDQSKAVLNLVSTSLLLVIFKKQELFIVTLISCFRENYITHVTFSETKVC